MGRFESIGVIKNNPAYDSTVLDGFLESIDAMKGRGLWNKLELVDLFNKMIPDFNHKETGKYLDGRM